MFIEKLTEEEMRDFLAQNIKMDILSIEKVDNGYVAQLKGESEVLELAFSDFEVNGKDIMSRLGASMVENRWVHFMENKFNTTDYRGEYSIARLKHIQAQNGINR